MRDSKNDLGLRVNEQIRVSQVRLIGDDGEAFGVVDIYQARRIAEERGLDLVEVSPDAKPPVVKVIDYGKYKYEAQKKANESKKKQVQVQLKEIQLRPHIDKHDLDVKINKVKGFFDDGDKVKLVMQFKGREMAYHETSLAKFRELVKDLLEYGSIEEAPLKMMGTRAITILAPSTKKK